MKTLSGRPHSLHCNCVFQVLIFHVSQSYVQGNNLAKGGTKKRIIVCDNNCSYIDNNQYPSNRVSNVSSVWTCSCDSSCGRKWCAVTSSECEWVTRCESDGCCVSLLHPDATPGGRGSPAPSPLSASLLSPRSFSLSGTIPFPVPFLSFISLSFTNTTVIGFTRNITIWLYITNGLKTKSGNYRPIVIIHVDWKLNKFQQNV